MLKCISLTIITILISSPFLSAQTAAPLIDWQEWQEEITVGNASTKTLVYVYTDWCTLCKKFEQEALTDSVTNKLMTENFQIVGLNAESRADLRFKDEEYQYKRDGNLGYHELAAHLLDGRLAFPSLVFLDEDTQVIQVIHGYQGIEHLNLLLRYYGRDHYKSLPWGSFQRQYGAGQITDD